MVAIRAAGPFEEWGGITYALSAFDAALDPDWELVPLIKVGADLAPQARDYLGTLRRLAPDGAFDRGAVRNNRVVIRYQSASAAARCSRAACPRGAGLGLAPLVRDLDALYVNFISGFELDLPTMQLLRQHYHGPIYCDLHSLAARRPARRAPHSAPARRRGRVVPLRRPPPGERGGDGDCWRRDAMGLAATAMGAGVRVPQRHAGSARRGVLRTGRFRPTRRPSPSNSIAGIGRGVWPIRTALVAAAPPPSAPATKAIRLDVATCGAPPISLDCSRVIS